MKKIALCLFINIMGMILSSCFSDAPRDNPLDSQNSPQTYSFSGSVHTYYLHPPRSIIVDSKITLQPGDRITYSNSNGDFFYTNLPAGAYTIFCETNNFLADSIQVSLPEQSTIEFFLDGLPYFKEIKLNSHIISHWPPVEDLYYIELNVTASDTDGVEDLDLLWFEVAALGLLDTLERTGSPGLFNLKRQQDILSLNQYIGQEFQFYLRDKFGAVIRSDNHHITRIIEQTPQLTFPVQADTLTSPFQLSWQTVYLPFQFTLAIEITLINTFGIPVLMDRITGIPANTSSYLYSNNLDAGIYYWTLEIIDEFGNSSRSNEGTFIISP